MAPGDDTGDRLRAWRALLVAHSRLIEILEREMEAACGISLGTYEVLLHLAEAPEGRLRMSELAERVLLSRSGLTRLVDRMEEEGLVRREACPSDRRGAFAVLTPGGRQLQQRAGPVHKRGIGEHFGRHLSEEEARTVATVAERVSADLTASVVSEQELPASH